MGVNVISRINTLLNNSAKNISPPQTNSPNSLTNTVLSYLKKDDLNKAELKKVVSLVSSSAAPFPPSIYAELFNFCSSQHAIVEARKLESHLGTFYGNPPVFLLNRAIETYGKCGCLVDAHELFDEMRQRDGGSWNAIIAAYARGGRPGKAQVLFRKMYRLGFSATEVTFATVLGACAALLSLPFCMQSHGLMTRQGFITNVILASSLVDVYGKCGKIIDARKMFDEIKIPNAVSWNVIVRRYLEMGDGKGAVHMFFKMLRTNNIKPLNFTFSNALVACSSTHALEEGMQIHAVTIKFFVQGDEVISSSLIDMYVKCGKLDDAYKIFDEPSSRTIISWTSIMSGYGLSGNTKRARELFDSMPERNVISWNAMLASYIKFAQLDEAFDFLTLMGKKNTKLDSVTLVLIAKISSAFSDVELGKIVHGYVYRNGFYSNLFVGNSLLDMYGKCGHLKIAKDWFRQMGRWRDKVSWNSFLTSYARHQMSETAMQMFAEMQWEAEPSEYTFGTLLSACANLFSLNHGKQIHGFMIRKGYKIDEVVSCALLDMYSKCRCLTYAVRVFKQTDSRDLILWNSMIFGCYHNKRPIEVVKLFKLMEEERIGPDATTFHGVLLACASEGLTVFGRRLFDSISDVYFVIPRIEHYQCMIEMYGNHGHMEELEKFVEEMSIEPTGPMLESVLNAAKEHGCLKLQKWAVELLQGSPLISAPEL